MKTIKSRKGLVYIGIGIILIGIVTINIVVTPSLNRARLDFTMENMKTVIEQIRECTNFTGCPYINADILKQCIKNEKLLTDAWRNIMKARCNDKEIEIRSAGPDKVFFNEDDLVRTE